MILFSFSLSFTISSQVNPVSTQDLLFLPGLVAMSASVPLGISGDP